MKLLSLTLRDFRGVSSFSAQFDGKDAVVYGQNGSGKSTLVTAFLWLLYGKDARGRADYQIFPVDEGGNRVRQGMEPTVEAKFLCYCPPELDNYGTEISEATDYVLTLRRTLTENYSTQRGRSEKEYKGDVAKCYVDDVPKSVTEYGWVVAETFCHENLLRLLTCTGYFTGQIKNDDRRAFLFDAFGDVPDSEILAGEERFAPLRAAVGRLTIDDLMKKLEEQRRRANEELKLLPVRIDEAAKQLDESADGEAAKGRIAEIEREVAALREKAALPYPADEQRREIERAIRLKEQEIADMEAAEQRRVVAEQQAFEDGQRKALYQVQQAFEDVLADKQENERSIARQHKIIDALNKDRECALNDWHTENNKQFEADSVCPTCGRDYPAEQIDALRENWNEQKAQKLEYISSVGKTVREELDAANAELQNLNTEHEKLQSEYNAVQAALTLYIEGQKPFSPAPELAAEAEAKIAAAQGEVDALKVRLMELLGTVAVNDGQGKAKDALQAQIDTLQAEANEQQYIVLKAQQNTEIAERIAGYEADQKKHLAQREEAEGLLFLCEDFIRTKVAKIEGNINSHFQLVRFKLFENQKNGGLKQVCEVTVDGVPYESLNRARQVAANLDVIATFGKRYGLLMPIFVDDSEGVFLDYGVSTGDAQRITMIATEDDERLRVEVKGETA